MADISWESFKNEDGSIDWKARKQANIDRGGECYTCGSFIFNIFDKPEHKCRRQCGECASLENKEELDHSRYVRCPKCGYYWDPSETEDYQAFEDGEHSMTCGECEFEFEISTSISYNFQSPELEKNEVV